MEIIFDEEVDGELIRDMYAAEFEAVPSKGDWVRMRGENYRVQEVTWVVLDNGDVQVRLMVQSETESLEVARADLDELSGHLGA